MESYPKFHNEIGVPIVRIGCHEFECIGDRPPQDHPHIYLNMGDTSEIVCPYCSTLVFTLARTELKSSNAASLVMLPAVAAECRIRESLDKHYDEETASAQL